MARKASAATRIAVFVALVVLVASGVIIGGILAVNSREETPPVRVGVCEAQVGDATYSLNPSQASFAALIAGISVQRGLPPRAASIAIATAMQESSLRNLDYGDQAGPDSRGLYQQRPSQGWGTEAQVMDPVYATNIFYDRLLRVPDYQNIPLTEAAQAVQNSAFPEAYARRELAARAFASSLTGQSEGTLNCLLPPTTAPGDLNALATAAATAFGPFPASQAGSTLSIAATGSAAWAVAHWAVANAEMYQIERVNFGGLEWDRTAGGWQNRESTDGQVLITVAGPSGSPN